MSSAVVVRTRTAFRAQLFYTEEIERLSRHGSSSPSQNPDRGQTFLQWEFSTGGYDIFFKIVFTPVDPDAFHAARAGSSEPSLEHLGVAFPETSTPPSSPLLSEKEPGGVSPVLQPAPSPILGDDNPVMRSQSWGPGVSGSSLVGAAEAPNAPLLTSLSAHGTAPVLPSRHIVVVPSVKCNSQKGTISGSLLITGKTGVYTFVWDNTASLVTSKHIAYRAGTLTFT
ncbi:hypothetical protein DFJ74DRAFT_137950 [Hyaloraphidium curvatum]|nr:hypothetical protein DFJ74DRAFT_137950 [Hyaloraphidium curvatum]